MLPFIAAILAAAPRALSISPSVSAVNWGSSIATVYAVYKLDADGFEYTNSSAQTSTANAQGGLWLDFGAAEQVWVERTINSGSLGHADPGAGRLQLNTDRSYGVSRANEEGVGSTVADVDFDFYDAATGGVLLLSTNVIFTAEVETP